MTNNFRRFAFSKRGAFRLILFEIEVTKGIGANIYIYIYIFMSTAMYVAKFEKCVHSGILDLF